MTRASNSPKPAAKGGFQHGLPTVSTLPVQQSECCGTTSQSAEGRCCGEPTSSLILAADTQVTGGCCGEPAQEVSLAGQQRCC